MSIFNGFNWTMPDTMHSYLWNDVNRRLNTMNFATFIVNTCRILCLKQYLFPLELVSGPISHWLHDTGSQAGRVDLWELRVQKFPYWFDSAVNLPESLSWEWEDEPQCVERSFDITVGTSKCQWEIVPRWSYLGADNNQHVKFSPQLARAMFFYQITDSDSDRHRPRLTPRQ